jgi:DNA-binding response OmpR family regulator
MLSPGRPDVPLSVLIVEDNPDAAESLAACLRLNPAFYVTLAADGEAGVEAALRDRPGAVICDIGLPKMDGFEVARELRRGLSDRPFLIALTAYGDLADRLFDAGYDRYFVKPVDVTEIETVLSLQALRRRANAG